MATAKQLAGSQRRTLRTMREKLLQMADAWEDFDEFNRTRLTEVADRVEEVATELVDENLATGWSAS